jgi:hypothetical protein
MLSWVTEQVMGVTLLGNASAAWQESSGVPGVRLRLQTSVKGFRHTWLLLALASLLSACASKPYTYSPTIGSGLEQSSETLRAGGYQVQAAVPGADQARSFLGVDVYARNVQPVWLKIRNDNATRARVVISSIDPKYFPPAEVAWYFKKEFSKEGWMALERRLIDLSLPRFIEPGETVSGLVFTNLSPGTKSFNLEIFRGTRPPTYEQFTFFLRVPGFVPDYAQVRFAELYANEELQQIPLTSVPAVIDSLPCCTTSSDGSSRGRPANVYVVSEGLVLLKALLRAGWVETIVASDDQGAGPSNYLFGRPADGKFRKPRDGTTDRTELAIWKTPVMVDGVPLWAAQVRHAVGRRFPLGDRFFGVRLDPDVDEGRNYVIQTFWYAQTLEKWGLTATGSPVSQQDPELDLLGNPWFSLDGLDAVLWLSDELVPMNEARYVEWDDWGVAKGRNQ